MTGPAEDLVIAAGELDNVQAAVTRKGPCDRCHGRMMVDAEGDSVCFSCGNVVYRLPPLADADSMKRAPRRRFHGGIDIS